MTELTKKVIIKEQNYAVQLLCHCVFMFAGFLMTIIELSRGTDFSVGSLIYLALIIGGVFIPFGIYLGLYKGFRVLKKFRYINNNEMRVCIKKITDKYKRASDGTNRYCQLVFSENDGMWVAESKWKEFKVGDEAYVIYLSDDKDGLVLFPCKSYKLADELKTLLEGTNTNEQQD